LTAEVGSGDTERAPIFDDSSRNSRLVKSLLSCFLLGRVHSLRHLSDRRSEIFQILDRIYFADFITAEETRATHLPEKADVRERLKVAGSGASHT
jgi:hypothetical protein